ncbi:MAG: ABC transporter substrate-binding protein [Nitrospirales bacterium]
MKNRVQSSRLHKPWGFFILGRMCHRRLVFAMGWSGILLWCLVLSVVLANGPESESMKRRQQGILTGMPFMSNIAPRTFVDDLDRKLYLAKPPTRIVSLAPSITEILFAIGLDHEIVGVTDFCNYPPAALTKPKVAYSQPNLEAVVALQPQLVLAPESFLRADLLDKLDQLKIPTFIMESHSVEGIFSHMQVLGRMLGRSPQANEQAARLRQEVAHLTQQLEGQPRPTLLYVLNSNPLMTVGPGSFIHHLFELAGARNAAERADAPYPRLTMEEVLKQNPDILLFPVGEHEAIPQADQDAWKRWDSLNAVRQGRLVQIRSDLLNRPGPRVVEALKALVQLIHPELSLTERPEHAVKSQSPSAPPTYSPPQ